MKTLSELLDEIESQETWQGPGTIKERQLRSRLVQALRVAVDRLENDRILTMRAAQTLNLSVNTGMVLSHGDICRTLEKITAILQRERTEGEEK